MRHLDSGGDATVTRLPSDRLSQRALRLLLRSANSPTKRLLAAILAVSALACWQLLPDLSEVDASSYHGDEGRWIAVSDYAFRKFFLERDWSREAWNDGRFRTFGTRNPTVGKYVIGASLHLHGVDGRHKGLPRYRFRRSFEWNSRRGNVPPDDERFAARLPVALMGVLASVLLLLLAKQLSGSLLVALLAAAFFVSDPLVLSCSRHAMIDTSALFFSLGSILLAVRTWAAIARSRTIPALLWSFGFGVAVGLSVGTKLNALLIPPICALWGIVGLLRTSRADARRDAAARWREFPSVSEPTHTRTLLPRRGYVGGTACCLGIALLVGCVTFVASNPFLHHAPVEGVRHLIEFKDVVASSKPKLGMRLDGLSRRGSNLLAVGLGHRGTAGIPLDRLGVEGAFALLGFVVWMRRTQRHGLRTALGLAHIWFLIWMGTEVVGILHWVPFDWRRWYLPLAPCWAILRGTGAAWLVEGLMVRARTDQGAVGELAAAQRGACSSALPGLPVPTQ